MKTLIIVTAGQSDVQIVCDGTRHEFSTNNVGSLLDFAKDRGYRLVDSPPQKSRERLSTLPEGAIALCTPKLDAILREFQDRSSDVSVLILDTQRHLDSDPRQAGDMMSKRLHESGISAVTRCGYLFERERLEDVNNPKDCFVRRSVISRILAAMTQELARLDPDRIIVAATGGLANVNEVVVELTRLLVRDSKRVVVLEVADSGRNGEPDKAIPERFHPPAGIRARWQALRLIEAGNFIGAWGAVSHLSDDPMQSWTRVVHWLYQFASALPISDDCDLPNIKHSRLAVRAAIRVELALRAGDVPRAVHGTIAFIEAALWDGLYEHFERIVDDSFPPQFRLKNQQEVLDSRLVRRPAALKGKVSSDSSTSSKPKGEWLPFVLRKRDDGSDSYEIKDMFGGVAQRIAEDYLRRPKLSALYAEASREVRDLRNDVAHNEPTPALMSTAESVMVKTEFWSQGRTFLSQPLVQDALRELGVADPQNLLKDLLREIRARLRSLDLD